MIRRDIDFGDDSAATIVGRTRSGKTTGALYSLQRQPRGVIFFNTQLIRFPRVWTQADIRSDFEDILDELIGGGKVVYNPSREYRQQDLAALIALLFRAAEERDGELDIYVVVDEVHLYTGKALKACIEVATTGIRWGLKAVWISQRPAKIDNTLMTQSTRFVIFDLSHMEGNYLKNYQMPAQDILSRLAGQKYGYVVYDGHELSTAFTVPLKVV